MDADEPDRPEVIQGADLLLSSFQGHLRFLSQTKERWHCLLAPVMCGAAGGVASCPGLWCVGRHPAEDCTGQHCLLSRH